MATTYYAVCNVGGPISVELEGGTVEEARAAFDAGDKRAWIDEPRTDLEDALDLCCQDMSEDDFAEAVEAAGATTAGDLSPIANAHAGTVAHLADGWMLWSVSDE